MTRQDDLRDLRQAFDAFVATSEELRRSYERLEARSGVLSLYLSTLMDQMNPALLVCDQKGILHLWNRAASLLYPPLANQTPPLDPRTLPALSQAPLPLPLATPFPPDTTHLWTVEGQQRWIRISASPYRDSQIGLEGHLLLMEDITRLRQLEERSRQEDRLRAMGELAAEVAHEIRNPLAGLELLIPLLNPGTDRERDILARMSAAVTTMNHTVSNILLYTRSLNPHMAHLQFQALLEPVLEQMEHLRREKKATITIHDDADPITADADMLSACLANLLRNALEAIPMEGQVIIAHDTAEGGARITLEDNGPGIPNDLLPRIFRPFFTTKNTGTGLGLALAERIAQAHEGTLAVTNIPGSGARFTLTLPHNARTI